MLCQICQKNDASVNVKGRKGASPYEINICQSCANKSFIGGEVDFGNIVGFLLGSMVKRQEKTCKGCGLTYDGFRANGKFGCDRCVETFREQLYTVLKQVQSGGVSHVGKIPKSLGGNLKEISVSKLESDLAQAIKEERYEDAAFIRDEIRHIRGEADGSLA